MFLEAEIVITDSFHGTAYSVNLGKRFVVVAPGRFSGRIANLLGMTGLESHLLSDFRDIGIADEIFDSSTVQERLDKERAKADAFLRDALGDGSAE